MLQIGYFNGERLHINDYNPQIHTVVKCADGHTLIAKRGDIREHHFCHRAKEGTDNCSGSDGMSNWHKWWQNRLLPNNIEYRFNKEILKIADSVNGIGPNKSILSIVEFQHSKMDIVEFSLRQKFYTRTDLLLDKGIPYCQANLTWIFDLTSCDIEIDHVFGDIICFRWVKGSKFMFPAGEMVLWDLGKLQLCLIFGINKPKIMESRIIGRLISLEDIDNFYFEGALKPNLKPDEKRLNTHPIADCKYLTCDIKRQRIVDLAKQFYFAPDKKKSNKNSKSKADNLKSKTIKITKEDIENELLRV